MYQLWTCHYDIWLDFADTSSLMQYTLMKDPVILPSSRVILDRPVILRHLLSDSVNILQLCRHLLVCCN